MFPKLLGLEHHANAAIAQYSQGYYNPLSDTKRLIASVRFGKGAVSGGTLYFVAASPTRDCHSRLISLKQNFWKFDLDHCLRPMRRGE